MSLPSGRRFRLRLRGFVFMGHTGSGARQKPEGRQANHGTSDVLAMSPAQHLTACYATGEDAWAWRMRLRTLPSELLWPDSGSVPPALRTSFGLR